MYVAGVVAGAGWGVGVAKCLACDTMKKIRVINEYCYSEIIHIKYYATWILKM